MARGIEKDESLPGYARPLAPMIKAAGFNWVFWEDRKLAVHRIQVRNIEELAPPREVAQYAVALRRGDQMPPVIHTADGYLVDGNTRTEACRHISRGTFPAFVLDVDYGNATASQRKQLQILGTALNNIHGRGMKKADVASIIAAVGEDDTSPKDLARRLKISETTAGTYLNAALAHRRAGKVGVKLNGTLASSVLKLFGNKSRYFSDDVYKEFLLLAQDAHLTVAAVTSLSKRLEAISDGDLGRLELLNAERDGYHDVIEGGSVNPSKAAKLRQSLGFLNGQDAAVLAELDPNASRLHTRTLRTAMERIEAIFAEQERVERARLQGMESMRDA
jgi:hypothetical protein